MIHVRRHKRVTASGRTVTVRAHEREGDDGVREVPQWSRPATAADFRPSATVADERGTSPEFREMFLGEAPAGDWWDDSAAEPDDAPEFGSPAAREELRAARAELERVSRRDREETEDYHRANARVIEAEKHVPWWRR